MKGFLGTWASSSAHLNLVIQIAMGIELLAGAFLARTKTLLCARRLPSCSADPLTSR
jgi:hypothetical protein